MKTSVSFKISSLESIAETFLNVFTELQNKNSDIFFSQQFVVDIKTAFVEAVANAIKHAGELKLKGFVSGSLFMDEKSFGFQVFDHGKGFDLEAVPVPDLNEFKETGRGIFMMKQLGDSLSYKQTKKENTLTFKRNFVGSENSRELDLFYELSEAIVRQTSVDEVYQIILDRALKLFHVERASVLIYDEGLKALKMVASRGIDKDVKNKIRVKSGEGVSGYVFRHGRPLLIEDIERNKRGIEKKNHYKTGSFISAPMVCSPLRLDEKPIGVINLTDRIDGKNFSKRDLKLLSTIANQAMACLYIKGLVDHASKAEILKQEMEQLRVIQNSYLPKASPAIKNYDIYGWCEMAQSVGGDYFDYILIDPYLYVVVADVSGHSTRSAVTMVNFRSQLKAFTSLLSDPADILTKLNRSMHDDLQKFEQFVSCLLIRFDTQTGEFVLANAGHYPPFLFSTGELVKESSLVMGIEKTEAYQNVKGALKSGDGFFIYTDGVIESVDESDKVFGIERLTHEILQNKNKTSRELVSHVIKSVAEFRSIGKRLDDITVVSVIRK